MRRFGIPILLCSAYILIMLLVFSTDFGQQSTLFFPQHQGVSQTATSDIDTLSTAQIVGTVDSETDAITLQEPSITPVQDLSDQAEGGDNNPVDK